MRARGSAVSLTCRPHDEHVISGEEPHHRLARASADESGRDLQTDTLQSFNDARPPGATGGETESARLHRLHITPTRPPMARLVAARLRGTAHRLLAIKVWSGAAGVKQYRRKTFVR